MAKASASLVFPEPDNPVRSRKRRASSEAQKRRINFSSNTSCADFRSAWKSATSELRSAGGDPALDAAEKLKEAELGGGGADCVWVAGFTNWVAMPGKSACNLAMMPAPLASTMPPMTHLPA